MKKLPLFTTLILLILFSINSYSQSTPRNLQVTITEIISQSRTKIECKAVTKDGECVIVFYRLVGMGSLNHWKIGSKLTIHAYYEDEEGVRHFRRIKFNQ